MIGVRCPCQMSCRALTRVLPLSRERACERVLPEGCGRLPACVPGAGIRSETKGRQLRVSLPEPKAQTQDSPNSLPPCRPPRRRRDESAGFCTLVFFACFRFFVSCFLSSFSHGLWALLGESTQFSERVDGRPAPSLTGRGWRRAAVARRAEPGRSAGAVGAGGGPGTWHCRPRPSSAATPECSLAHPRRPRCPGHPGCHGGPTCVVSILSSLRLPSLMQTPRDGGGDGIRLLRSHGLE